MSVTISARIPDGLAKKLTTAAKATDRKPSYFVQKALEKYFEDEFDYQVALERLFDKNDKALSIDEVRDELGL